MRKLLPFSLIFILCLSISSAQEIESRVSVNFEQLPAQNKEYLEDFARRLEDYINNHKWTDVDIGEEKIECSIDIFFTYASENTYRAQIFIGSKRKVYNSERKTVVLRVRDDRWDFFYDRNQPFYHDELRFDPLLSLIDFYMYLVIGYDFDTYEPFGGTKYFEKAFQICSNAISSRFARGWQKTATGFSRYNLISELLDPKYSVFRKAMFDYHYNGLDILSDQPDQALAKIDSVIDVMIDIKRNINQTANVVKLFFDAKYLELAEIFRGYKDSKKILRKLMYVDPGHQSIYQEYIGR
jgi:hypothetical protein